MSITAALNVARRYASGGAVETNPSPAQSQAGNYKMRHITFQGIPISIENPKGTIRRGIDAGGKPWANRMAADYGYIKRTEGKDGDQVDAFVGPFRNSDRVFIIDQLHRHKEKFDEHKCLLGFNTKKQALTAYHRSYGRVYGHHHTVGAVTELSVDAFKEWLKGGGGKEPVAPDVPKYQDGGLVFDPDYLKNKSKKTPNIRVTEGHQEFEKGYAPSGRSPWNTAYPYRPILNMRGQELDALKIKTGGAVKVTKEKANYRLGTKSEHCGICTMFRAPDSCTAVKGKIRRQDTCNYFEMKRKKYAEGGGTKLGIPTSDALTEITHQPMATAWRGSTSVQPEPSPMPSQSINVPIAYGEAGYPYKNVTNAEVLVNPAVRDVRQMLREAGSDIAGVDNPGVRTVRDTNGNLLVWRGDQATHIDLDHSIRHSHQINIDPTTEGFWEKIGMRESKIIQGKAEGGKIRTKTMPLIKSGSESAKKQNIREFHTGPTYAHTKAKFGKARADAQAVAAALSTARRYGKKKAFGGPNIESMIMRGASYGLRREGMINSTIPGRTDKIPMSVRVGSYVIPSDVVSGLGQNSSAAGGAILDKMFSRGPYGMATMKSAGRSGMSLAPRMSIKTPRPPKGMFADGGETEGKDHVPIIAAGQEYIVHPDVVRDIGHGSINAGHRVLDAFCMNVRKKNIKTLKSLPPPKK